MPDMIERTCTTEGYRSYQRDVNRDDNQGQEEFIRDTYLSDEVNEVLKRKDKENN